MQLGRIEDAKALLTLLDARPPGHVPPYLRAQLVRGRALIAAAEGRDDAVERDLRAAIDTFRELDYRYWKAVAQTDLGDWLASREEPREAAALLADASAALLSLGATPALGRAQELLSSDLLRYGSGGLLVQRTGLSAREISEIGSF